MCNPYLQGAQNLVKNCKELIDYNIKHYMQELREAYLLGDDKRGDNPRRVEFGKDFLEDMTLELNLRDK